ncbi:hypothetical protein [Aneurinibacillus migulanus]|uniref:hypothetical protein n=1 Tax=Aneurinibacillus migulanus TaxID=47500 RepID=UPI0020A0277D|nr:hypothetical protein [Aneurinibacillus migulanus]MCP1358610.1 hypothetical protein [Aneurinibacillus migulanus]
MKTITEIKRMIKEKGYLVVMDSGFISNESRVVYETLNIIKRFTSDRILRSAGSKAEAKEFKNGFPSSWFNEWKKAGFHLIDS